MRNPKTGEALPRNEKKNLYIDWKDFQLFPHNVICNKDFETMKEKAFSNNTEITNYNDCEVTNNTTNINIHLSGNEETDAKFLEELKILLQNKYFLSSDKQENLRRDYNEILTLAHEDKIIQPKRLPKPRIIKQPVNRL